MKNNNNIFKKDILHFIFLYLLSIIAVYKLPHNISFIYQIILLGLFYYSKSNYFWMAFVFIVESFPGGIFSIYGYDANNTFSLIYSSPFGILYFWMAFLLIALIKLIVKREQSYNLIINKNIIILLSYFVFLFLVFGFYKWTSIIRTLLPWILLIIMPRFFHKDYDFAGFFNLIFIAVFFVLLTQIFQLATGRTLANFLGSNIILISENLENINKVARPVNGIHIAFFSLFGALYYLTVKENYFSNTYLFLIIGISILSIFITATRGWLISMIFLIISFFLTTKNKLHFSKFIILPFLVILFIIIFSPLIQQQVNLSLERYKTIEYLAKGDLTAGGTLNRLTRRGPVVMKKFSESPIIGWGYGLTANKYADMHVANQTLLLHNGIIGFAFWLYLWISFIAKMIILNRRLSINNPYKDTPTIFALMMISLLIINSSSTTIFDFQLYFNNGFLIIFLFSFASFVYYKSQLHTIRN